MNDFNMAELIGRLDAIDAKLAAIGTQVPRIEYSREEFAQMAGISADTLRKAKYYRRYGGRKIGGRIRFSEAARRIIAEGKR